MTSPIDINPYHLDIVRDILHKYLPTGFSVWVFGSRATWTTRFSSDLDIAVQGKDKLDYDSKLALDIAFDESALPYTVDIIDLNNVNPQFKRIVDKEKVPLPIDKFASNII